MAESEPGGVTGVAARRTVRDQFAEQTKLAVFGAFDGVVTVLGAVFPNTGNPHTLTLTCVGLAASGAVSMGGGELVSDSDAGWAASTAIGATTGLGTLVPIVPYWFTSGTAAITVSMLLCLAVAVGISWLKSTQPGVSLRSSALQTHAILVVAAGLTLLAAWLTGAVG